MTETKKELKLTFALADESTDTLSFPDYKPGIEDSVIWAAADSIIAAGVFEVDGYPYTKLVDIALVDTVTTKRPVKEA